MRRALLRKNLRAPPLPSVPSFCSTRCIKQKPEIQMKKVTPKWPYSSNPVKVAVHPVGTSP